MRIDRLQTVLEPRQVKKKKKLKQDYKVLITK